MWSSHELMPVLRHCLNYTEQDDKGKDVEEGGSGL